MAEDIATNDLYITLSQALCRLDVSEEAFFQLAQEHEVLVMFPLSVNGKKIGVNRAPQNKGELYHSSSELPVDALDIGSVGLKYFTLSPANLSEIYYGTESLADWVGGFALIDRQSKTFQRWGIRAAISACLIKAGQKEQSFRQMYAYSHDAVALSPTNLGIGEFNHQQVLVSEKDVMKIEGRQVGSYEINAWSNPYIVDLNVGFKKFFVDRTDTRSDEVKRWLEERWRGEDIADAMTRYAWRLIVPGECDRPMSYSALESALNRVGLNILSTLRERNQLNAPATLLLLDFLAEQKWAGANGYEVKIKGISTPKAIKYTLQEWGMGNDRLERAISQIVMR